MASHYSYWTEPGEHELVATLKTGVSPGSEGREGGHGRLRHGDADERAVQGDGGGEEVSGAAGRRPARLNGSGPGAGAGQHPAASTPRRSRTFATGFRRPSAAVPRSGYLVEPVLRTGVEPVGRASETQLRVRRTESRPVRKAGIEPASTGSRNPWPTNGPHPESSRVPAAGVEPAPPRFQRGATTELASPRVVPPVPRQGIEPCVCRLKAGGFAIEACEAHHRVPGAGIEPAASTFKEWQQYQH